MLSEPDFIDVDFDLDIFNDFDFADAIFTGDGERVSNKNSRASSTPSNLILTVVGSLKKRKVKTGAAGPTAQRNKPSAPSSASNKRRKLVKQTTTIMPDDVISDENDKLFHRGFISLLAPRPQRFIADSIRSFPTALVNCLNSCNNYNLTNLMRGSLNDDCAVGVTCIGYRVSLRAFVKFIGTLDIIHPDRVYNISNISVGNDRITASTTVKFTDCKKLYNLVFQTTADPDLATLFNSRADHMMRRLSNYDNSQTNREQMARLVASDADLLVSGILTFQISIDEDTKNVTGFYVAGSLTSAHAVPSPRLFS